jgi:hypothetical protein
MKTTVEKISLFLILIAISCSDTTTFPIEHQIEINIDSEITESWIDLHIDGLNRNAVYYIERDTTIIFSGILEKADTLFHDIGLLPATEYTYRSFAVINGEHSRTTTQIINTMDTTSHNFEGELFIFGNQSPSTLNDVVIISPTDIWAVGEILINDIRYNAIHWNGNSWEYIQIPVKQFNSVFIADLLGVYAIDANNIWFTDGGGLQHWDGKTFTTVVFMEDYVKSDDFSLLKRIWVLDENNIYLVSDDGNVIYFDGKEYKELIKTTQASINDLWNSKESQEPNAIFGAVSNKYSDSEYFIMKLENETVGESFNWRTTGENIFALWFKDFNKLFAIGTDLTDQFDYHIFKRDRGGKWHDLENPVDSYFLHAIRGNDINDIFVCGDFLAIAHFNGFTWKEFNEFRQPAAFYRMDFKEDLMVAVGITARDAILLKMERN